MDSSYDWDDFKKACQRGAEAVAVFGKAATGAREDFNLKTTKELLKFIGSGGVQELDLIKPSRPWLENPNPEVPIMVDSYNCFVGSVYGYLAFMFSPQTRRWLLKSFKKNKNLSPRNDHFADALKKALQSSKEET